MTDQHRNPHDQCKACRPAPTEQSDLFAWRPSPPSEPSPTPERYKRAKGDPRDYGVEWFAFVAAHPEVGRAVEWEAIVELRAGSKRIAIAAIFERVRAALHVHLNASWRAPAADWLIAREPRLADVIERRARKVTR